MLRSVAVLETYNAPEMFIVASENCHARHSFKEYQKLEPSVIPQNLMTMNYMTLIFPSLVVCKQK